MNRKNILNNINLFRWLILSFILIGIINAQVFSQATITTTFTNNNGSTVVTFNFENTNATDVIITEIGSVTSANGLNTAEVFYNPTAINGAPGAINTTNGWTSFGTGSYTAVANTTTSTAQMMLTGLSLVVPAGATYGICFSTTNLRYSTLTAGTYSIPGGGCNINTGTNIGYGGTLTSPTNTPRGFIGYVTFISATPCSGTPVAGTITAPAGICSGNSFNINLTGTTMASGITYQWQSSSDNITFNDIPGATNLNYTATQTVPTYYQCVVTCTASGLSDITPSVEVLINPLYNCYCTSNATSTADEEILNVTLGTLNNTSTCSTTGGTGSILNQYSNYTALSPPSLGQSTSNSFSVEVGTCGGNFSNGLAIWIDYNQNGSFADPGENVYSSTATTTGPHVETGTITIPITATLGVTGMRVIVQESVIPSSSCGTYTWGETEDYLVEIVPAPTCIQPTSLNVSNITDVSATLGWTPSNGEILWDIQYGLTGFPLGSGTILNNVNTNPYILSGLTPATTYQFYVLGQCSPTDSSFWSGPFSFTTNCSSMTATYTQNFDAVTTPNIPLCWSKQVVFTTGTPNVQTSTTTPNSAPNCAQLYNSTASGSGTHLLLITPQFSDLPSQTTQIRFWARFTGGGTGFLNVGTMSDPSNPATFSSFQAIMTLTGTWQEFVIPFSTYVGTNEFIAFKHGLGLTNQYIYIDNFVYETIPTCPQPSVLSAANITDVSADLNWTSNGSETNWNIEYGPSGFVQGTGTTVNVTAHPYTLNGLSPASNYSFYVQADCGGGDLSAWTGPYNFATLCGVISSFPWSEHFNTTTIPNCWTMSGPQSWLFTTTWPGYGAAGVTEHTANGGSFAGVDGSGTAGLTGIDLITPLINTSSLTTPQVRFYLFNNNTNNADYQTLSVDIYDGAAWNNGLYVWTSTMNDPQWQEITVLLNSLTITGPIQIRFSVSKSSGSPFYDDIMIDDVYVEEAPTCIKPNTLTASNVLDVSADLGWTTVNGESMWDIQWGPTGFPLGSGTIVNDVTSNPYVLTGLTPTTSYQYYVLAQCSPTDSSIWAGPYTFTTQMTLCTGTPTPGSITSSVNPICPGINFDLIVAGYTVAGGVDFQWQSSPDGVTFTDIPGATNDTLNISQNDTTYYQCVVTCTGSGLSDVTIVFIENTNSFINCYCTSNATSTADEEIFNVTLGTLNNTSTCSTVAGPGSILNEYSNFTGITPPDLSRSLSYPSSVEVNTCGTSNYNSGVAIFIDFNQNGLFTDPGEKVYSNGALANITCIPSTIVNGTITVPLNAVLGNTRMRVIDAEGISGDAIVPCGTYGFGETEDYLVNIIAAPSCVQPDTLGVNSVLDVSATITWTPGISETLWDIEWGPNGFVQGTGTLINDWNTTSYSLTGLTPTTTYQFYVLAQCSPTDSSYWAGPFTFTTACGINSLPFVEQFNTTTIPNCWTMSGPQSWLFTTSWPAYGASGVTEHSANGGSFAGVDGSGTTLLTGITLTSPLVDLGTATDVELQFWLFNNNVDDASYQELHVDYFDGTAWNNSVYLWNSTSNDPAWQHIIVNLASYPVTGPVQFRFVVDKSSGSPFYDDIMIDDILLWEKPQYDLSVISWDSPNSGCGLTSAESITIQIVNGGINSMSNFLVGYTIDGGATGVPETVPGPLAPGDTMTYTFTTTADFSVNGVYNCGAAIIDPLDQFHNNDTIYTTVVSQQIVNTYPYLDDFEGVSGWTSGGVNNTWALGTPAGTTIIGASSGTNAWMTGLSTNYNNSENSYVISSCFDFSSLSNPFVRFKQWTNAENSWDGALLQSSIDGGATWQTIGAMNDPINWYNDNSIVGLAYTGLQEGWTGATSTGWTASQHSLSNLAGQSSVKFRMAFGADGSVNSYDGFAFDDFEIFDASDLAVVYPIDGTYNECGMNSAYTSNMCIKNVGSTTIPLGSSVFAWYQVNGGIAVADTVVLVADLLPNDSICFDFSQTYDFSIPTSYLVNYWISYNGDAILTNDTSYTTIVNYNLYVNILGGDTIPVEPIYMPYTLSVQASPFTYDSYYWSNFDGSVTGTSSTFDTPDFGWYYLTVTDGACTATDSVYVDMLNGTINTAQSNSISVYPNPTDGKFNLVIKNNQRSDYKVELYSSDGRKVIDRMFRNVSEVNQEFDGTNLAEGMYSLKIIGNGRSQVFMVAIY